MMRNVILKPITLEWAVYLYEYEYECVFLVKQQSVFFCSKRVRFAFLRLVLDVSHCSSNILCSIHCLNASHPIAWAFSFGTEVVCTHLGYPKRVAKTGINRIEIQIMQNPGKRTSVIRKNPFYLHTFLGVDFIFDVLPVLCV